ncbi:MAG: calcium-binding protein [Conexibacter sp.]|nr:calcium-binding protein [Conexibacter sp.]
MHGRLWITALAAALVAALAVAQPAAADETLGLGQPAAVDGVVTSWTVMGADGQTVRLRSVHEMTADTETTAEGEPVFAGPGAIAARLPIGAGGELALSGASGSPTVSATVEPDADGDAYGDTTQDACPGDATAHAAPCLGVRTIGSPLTLGPDDSGMNPVGNHVQVLQMTAPGTVPSPQARGILVRWRVRSRPGTGDVVLQLLRPTSSEATTFTVVDETAPVHVADTGVVTVPATMPILPGDRLAIRTTTNPDTGSDTLTAYARHTGDDVFYASPPAVEGQTWTPQGHPPIFNTNARLLVQADVEPDADRDGRGDVTQSSADLQLTAQATDSATHVYTVRNLGPGTSHGVALSFGAADNLPFNPPAGVVCTSADQTCRIAELAAGASLSLSPIFVMPAIYPYSATLRSTARVSAVTPDPNPANDGPLSLSTFFTTGGTVTPPPPPALCANVVRGTRDDDVLRGTAFADRLVGGDGDDLLKGLGGADCLEGGKGDDVLDGGDGDDRLAGASGKDRLSGGTGNDKLTGGAGNDRLTGGPGNDAISPGSGHDVVDAGGGNDTINSVDGVRESVDCGAGKDTVRADRRDRLKHCEKVTRR